MGRGSRLESLQNMNNLIASWPPEKRRVFYGMVGELERLAAIDPLNSMAVMYAGMKVATDRLNR